MDAAAEFRAQLTMTPGVVEVIFGSADPKPGLLEFHGQPVGPDGLAQTSGEIITLTFCTPDLPGLLPGSILSAGGASYSVTKGPDRRGDGLESVAELQEEP